MGRVLHTNFNSRARNVCENEYFSPQNSPLITLVCLRSRSRKLVTANQFMIVKSRNRSKVVAIKTCFTVCTKMCSDCKRVSVSVV